MGLKKLEWPPDVSQDREKGVKKNTHSRPYPGKRGGRSQKREGWHKGGQVIPANFVNLARRIGGPGNSDWAQRLPLKKGKKGRGDLKKTK